MTAQAWWPVTLSLHSVDRMRCVLVHTWFLLPCFNHEGRPVACLPADSKCSHMTVNRSHHLSSHQMLCCWCGFLSLQTVSSLVIHQFVILNDNTTVLMGPILFQILSAIEHSPTSQSFKSESLFISWSQFFKYKIRPLVGHLLAP